MKTQNGLTARGVAGLKATGRRQEIFDARVPGFYVRVSPIGRKSYGLLYRFRRRLRRYTIGAVDQWTLADARAKAREAIRLAAEGRDVATEKQAARQADTFADLASAYVERWAKEQKKSWREDERVIKKFLLPVFGKTPVADVRRADIRALLEDNAKKTPIQSNRIRTLVHRIFTWAQSMDLAESNPVSGLPKFGRERARDRVLTDSEIKALWSALEASRSPVAPAIKMMLLSGQRRGEIQAMRWAEVDMDATIWTIPAERSKNGRAHRVPLSPPAVRILERIHEEQIEAEERRARRHRREPEPDAFAFPNFRDRNAPIYNVKDAKDRIAPGCGDHRALDVTRSSENVCKPSRRDGRTAPGDRPDPQSRRLRRHDEALHQVHVRRGET